MSTGRPTVGSLFSGIGGLDLGLERAGWSVSWQSEISDYCCRVLKKHWPDVPNLGDVREVDWSTVERVDLICGGYPCQPFSEAGDMRGDADERHLWPFMASAIRHLRPRFVLLENVRGHLVLGFDRVLADLAELGFDAEWSLVSACSLGAPHMRRRLFCVAYAESERREWRGMAPWPAAESVADEGHVGSTYWTLGARHPIERVFDGIPDRVERLTATGNAVVPQVAQFIGEQLLSVLENAKTSVGGAG